MRNYTQNLRRKTPWLPEYSRLACIEWQNNDIVHVQNVRNFSYQKITVPIPDWYDCILKLSDVVATDLVLSYWGGNAIAHVFLSFGFRSGYWLPISIETRRRENQPWSAYGGFFKNYPLIYVVADEKDIIGVRLNIRKEQVYLYSLNITPTQSQILFRSYLMRTHKVNEHPEWYNTILNNCTSNIFHHGKAVSSSMKYDWSILVSGYVDRYCYRKKLLNNQYPFDELKARSRLVCTDGEIMSNSFSADIRRNR